MKDLDEVLGISLGEVLGISIGINQKFGAQDRKTNTRLLLLHCPRRNLLLNTPSHQPPNQYPFEPCCTEGCCRLTHRKDVADHRMEEVSKLLLGQKLEQ
jgi:hypothetical protein